MQMNAISKVKPKKQVEEEHREEGLKTAIGADNKGFNLLQKMGYKPGTSLGKDGTGRTEPIAVAIKTGRGGLGKDEELKRKREMRTQMAIKRQGKRKKMEVLTTQEFVENQRSRALAREVAGDLWKSQKACHQLDEQKNLSEPAETWFWPQVKSDEVDGDSDDSEDDSEDEELQPEEKLRILTAYLRQKHLFCIWCGTTYEDVKDMEDNCSGDTRECH